VRQCDQREFNAPDDGGNRQCEAATRAAEKEAENGEQGLVVRYGGPQIAEHLGQVVLDRPRAEEQLGGDLRVGQTRPGQPGDLGLLGVSWSCVSAMRRRGGLAGNLQLPADALGERLTVVG
jgi:hypothetical protein